MKTGFREKCEENVVKVVQLIVWRIGRFIRDVGGKCNIFNSGTKTTRTTNCFPYFRDLSFFFVFVTDLTTPSIIGLCACWRLKYKYKMR